MGEIRTWDLKCKCNRLLNLAFPHAEEFWLRPQRSINTMSVKDSWKRHPVLSLLSKLRQWDPRSANINFHPHLKPNGDDIKNAKEEDMLEECQRTA